jgi:hypothetical protein
VHELGREPLDTSNLLGVEAELKDVIRLRVPSKLRVDDLVAAIGPTLEKVSAPCPAGGIVEDGLVDHVASAAADESLSVSGVARLGDVPAGRAERSEVSGFVLVTLAPNELGLRVVDPRPYKLPTRDIELERNEMLALQEAVESRRRELHATN